ncbi:unnamed protein product [Cuscuta campestris]|uniref:Uncharacterized protein n=1 Tax=Cuscuta campestris TaxID=132261 RepID=A0A484N4U9_9ASTE|nr:unnamed protein product [Cuscuta campestris]
MLRSSGNRRPRQRKIDPQTSSPAKVRSLSFKPSLSISFPFKPSASASSSTPRRRLDFPSSPRLQHLLPPLAVSIFFNSRLINVRRLDTTQIQLWSYQLDKICADMKTNGMP